MRSEAWRPAAAARNRSPANAGTRASRHYDLGARSSRHGSARQLPAVVGRRAPKETEARPREPKTATVELFPEPGGVQCSFGGRNNPLLYRNISIWRTMA